MLASRFKVSFFISALLLLSACSNSLDITDNWSEIPVVYGLLNPNSSVNYIRLQRAFLGEGNAYLAAQNPDSIYYDTNRVSVCLIRYRNSSVIDTLPLSVSLKIPKDEGVFVEAPPILYACYSRLNADSKYRMLVTRQHELPGIKNTGSQPFIFNSLSGHQSSFLIKKSDLKLSGITTGSVLHSIGFVISKLNSSGSVPVTLYMSETNADCINPSAIPGRGIAVFNGNIELSAGWNDLYFTAPFGYDGNANLLVTICTGSVSVADELLTLSSTGCITTADADLCGSTVASATYEKYPLLRFGYSGNGQDFIITESTTPLISNLYAPYLASTASNINLTNDAPYSIPLKTSKNGFVYGLTARFRYLERKFGSAMYTQKTVDYNLPVQTSLTTNGGEDLEFKIQGWKLLQFIGNQVPVDPTIYRPSIAVRLDFEFRIGTREFYTYYVVNQPNNAIFNIPDFSTLTNGKGILSCRLDTIRTDFSISSSSIDSLVNGIYTKGRFQ